MKLSRNLLATPSEASEQRVLFEWASMNARRVPELECLYATPNGGSRHVLEAVNLKRTGVKAGIPDVFLPVARGKWHGLYIEMKKESLRPKTLKSKGGLSGAQTDWIVRLRREGYAVSVCYGADEAISTILRYLGGFWEEQ